MILDQITRYYYNFGKQERQAEETFPIRHDHIAGQMASGRVSRDIQLFGIAPE